MAIPLKESTASQEIPLGYFVDSTDGNTEETGLTIANTDIKLWKAGATTLASKNSGGATHISNGVYYCVLDATDTNTLGPLVVFIHVAGALAVRVECVVHPANVYDSLYGADKLQVDAVEISGDSGAADNCEAAFDGGSYNVGGGAIVAASVTGAVGSVTGNVGGNVTGSVGSLAAQAKADVNAEVDAALDTAIPGTPTANSINERLKTLDDADVPGRLPAALVSGRMDSSVGAMAADTLTASALAADAVTEIQSGLATASALGTVDTVVDAIQAVTDKVDDTLEDDGGTYRFTANALEQAPTGGSAPTAAEIADAVWDEATAGHTTAGTFGEQLKTDVDAILADSNELQGDWADGGRLDLILDARASQTSVDTVDDLLDTEVAAIKAKTDLIPASPAAVSDIPTAAENADKLLGRNVAGGSDGGRTVKQALYFLRNKVDAENGKVYETDDATESWTFTSTTNASAEPITVIDPA